MWMNPIDMSCYLLAALARRVKFRANAYKMGRYPGIDKSVIIGGGSQFQGPSDAIIIGSNSYLNEAFLVAAPGGRIVIGKNCCIGYRVSIKAWTHDPARPCSRIAGEICGRARDIRIGDRVWIGDGVYIREGVSIGNDCIVGANAVVTKSFPDGTVIVGVPAIAKMAK